MNPANFEVLFAYHWDTTQKLLDQADGLTPAEFDENPGYGRGSLHDLFYHILRTDQGWRIALETGRQQASISPEDFPDLDSLRLGCANERQLWNAYLSCHSTDQLQNPVDLVNRHGMTFHVAPWRVVEHVLLHGMQHHSEIAHLLTLKGRSPGDIDFIFYEG